MVTKPRRAEVLRGCLRNHRLGPGRVVADQQNNSREADRLPEPSGTVDHPGIHDIYLPWWWQRLPRALIRPRRVARESPGSFWGDAWVVASVTPALRKHLRSGSGSRCFSSPCSLPSSQTKYLQSSLPQPYGASGHLTIWKAPLGPPRLSPRVAEGEGLAPGEAQPALRPETETGMLNVGTSHWLRLGPMSSLLELSISDAGR